MAQFIQLTLDYDNTQAAAGTLVMVNICHIMTFWSHGMGTILLLSTKTMRVAESYDEVCYRIGQAERGEE